MLKIRLQRVGRKNDPSFRMVVLEGTEGPKSGNHVDQIGFYNAVTKQRQIDADKARHWISKGAQPTDTVYNMLISTGAIDGKKKNVLPSKSPIVKEEEKKEEAVPTPEATAEAPKAEATTEEAAPAEEEKPAEEAPAPAEEPKEEVKEEEKPVEEPKEEVPAEEKTEEAN